MMSMISALLISTLISILCSYLYKKRAVVYLLFILCLIIGHFITKEDSVAIRMFYLILITFFWMKCIVLVEYDLNDNQEFNLKRRLLFLFAWVGMNPNSFYNKVSAPLKDTADILKKSVFYLVLGVVTIIIIYKTSPQAEFSVHAKWVISYLSLFPISCILHFSFIPLSTVVIRCLGYPAPSFFKNPFSSESLAEFWGNSWNVPYADMIETAIFAPLKRYGLAISLIASFVFSGFLHEIAFTLPINDGYGLPTIYFLIQSILILFERQYLRRNTVWRRVLMYLALFLPLPLLFHPAFMKEVIWPILNFS